MSWSHIEDLHVQIPTRLHPHLVNEVPQQQTQIVQIMPVSITGKVTATVKTNQLNGRVKRLPPPSTSRATWKMSVVEPH